MTNVIHSITTAPVWRATARELDDLEMLLLGGYAPLRGFLGPADIASVAAHGHLADGSIFPVPVTLTVPAETADAAASSGRLELLDEEGTPVSELCVEQVWPVVGGYGVCGPVRALHGVERGCHRARTRAAGQSPGAGRPVLGVPVRGALHAPMLAGLVHLAESSGGQILLLPLVGQGSPTDVDGPGLIKLCMRAAEQLRELGSDVDMVPVPVPCHDAGDDADARLAVLVAGAYGATLVIGSGPGGPGLPDVVDVPHMVQDLRDGSWQTADLVPLGCRGQWAATEVPGVVGRAIADGTSVPPGLTDSHTERDLRRMHLLRTRGGVTVLFSGLSGSGKSTLANAVHAALLDRTDRTVTVLDGDLVRRMLSAELTFSRAHRELNIRRIGFVATEVSRHGGIALCAPIAPYASGRAEMRAMVEQCGRFLLVHVSTPIEVCEARDRKGLYAKARRGEIPEFTGVSDPYEVPHDADITIDTSRMALKEAVETIMTAIVGRTARTADLALSAPARCDQPGATPMPHRGVDPMARAAGEPGEQRVLAGQYVRGTR